jgi:hypothetical protein
MVSLTAALRVEHTRHRYTESLRARAAHAIGDQSVYMLAPSDCIVRTIHRVYQRCGVAISALARWGIVAGI